MEGWLTGRLEQEVGRRCAIIRGEDGVVAAAGADLVAVAEPIPSRVGSALGLPF